MKKILHKKILYLAIMFLGAISMNAQYVGKPYPDKNTPLQIGAVESTAYRLEMENFDQTDTNINGVNVTHTTSGTPPLTGTYYDKSAGNTGESPATGRTGSDVDTKLAASGTVLTGGQGQEYTLYTVQIMETGVYTLNFNYAHGAAAGKQHQLFLRKATDLTLVSTLYNGTLPKTASSSTYGNETISGISLTAGTYVVQSRIVQNGPSYDYLEFSRDPASPTMTSTGDGDWNNPATWTVSGALATVPSTTPTAEYDVVIGADIVTIPSGMGAATAKSITCKSGDGGQLILRQNNTLTVTDNISFDKSNDGMILYAQNGNFSTVTFGGTYLSGKKTTIIKRLSQDKWTLVSSGLSNSKQFKTLDDPRNYTVKVGTKHAFGSYDNTAASGSKYTYVVDGYGTGPTWGSGIGWATKSDEVTGELNTTDIKHDVVFQGDLHSADVPVSLANAGFNLVGNPYPTYLYGNDDTTETTNNVLTVNNGILAEPTLWFWDSDNEAWITKNQSSGAYHISPLQGFFVKTNAASTSFSFTEAMQTHTSNSDTFLKSSNNKSPNSKFSIDLSIETQERTTSTLINYLDNTTISFDSGYDSSTFGGYSSSFEVYTNLLGGDVSKKLAIQSLPNANFEDMIVPVGVSAEANSQITFTAETLNVPTGHNVYLEDRLKNTFTKLDEANAKYVATVSEKSTEGRFYLHTKTSALSTDTELLNSVSIYKSNAATLRIVGLSQGNTNVSLYNVLGKQVLSTSFSANGVKEISLPKLSKGVYIVQLETETGKLNKKIVLE